MLSPQELARYRNDHIVSRASFPACRMSGLVPSYCPGCRMLDAIAELQAQLESLATATQ